MSVPATTSKRIEIIDALRGVAALAVCWFHFTQGVGEFLPDGALKLSGAYGFLGVQIFFVISGFVIPYTLSRTSYDLRNYGRFIGKRVLRLDPPYFVSIALVLLIGVVLKHITQSYADHALFQSWPQLLLHIGYVNALFGYEWLNPIYWSLAIEFQYYLFLGLLFPLLFSPCRPVRIAAGAALCALPFINGNQNLVFWYFPWFIFGVYACYQRTGRIGRIEYFVATAILASLSIYLYGPVVTGTLVTTSLLITFYQGRTGIVLSFFGSISYSLYLTHAPVGCTLINLSKHYNPGFSGKVLILVLALGVTITASYLMYRFVEKPALNLAARISYRNHKPA